mmetsp:Transcript_20263/g.40886  ORF Transcript_20263/g.40886 Transcript_20263/m.40886 type:complete len:474 (+) Transcript_20263:116-1537(+)|eukprot:CAMPEP_0167793542 /NCGR_PEP_ID=MMETSP0111_2-20121227/13253_1 /TAXON_ID=91324 /ORGANISM="Lotharella globosa, Strain CCCM811" /LENGTH=473 /DNA_ID=CAMNT_0007686741 /DNA_START=118 /DNA_END=1539 /DNA_ORIENTATION=-
MSAVEETKAKDTSKPITNEFPQAYNEPDSYFCEETYALCMVGLPGMGKTFVAQRLARWLEFFHDVTVKVFNLGNARRKAVGSKVSSEFFNPSKHGNQEVYKKIRSNVIQEIKEFLVADKRPRIAIYDACSHTKETRRYLEQELGKKNTKIIFIECIVNDKLVLNEYLAEVQKDMPDYKGLDGAQTRKDYAKRIEHFRKRYEPLDDESKSWIKLVDNAEQLTLNRISGFFPGQIVNFLMNLHTVPRPIYLSRHGQSQYNALGKIGGDSGLTLEGLKYAKELAKFVKEHVLTGGGCENKEKDQCENASHARLYTSTLRRTNETAQFIEHPIQPDGWVTMRKRQWRALDELFAGVFDGMTYKEISEKCPEAYAMRKKNKLSYRYPRGESYLDVIKRVEQVMLHMQRHKDPVVIVAHQAILRVIYTYFMGKPREDATKTAIPLNTVIKLTPYAYNTKEERFVLHKMSTGDTDEAPSH